MSCNDLAVVNSGPLRFRRTSRNRYVSIDPPGRYMIEPTYIKRPIHPMLTRNAYQRRADGSRLQVLGGGSLAMCVRRLNLSYEIELKSKAVNNAIRRP